MPYATESDVIDRWPEAPVDPGDAALVTALDDATALIDTYLAKRWELPIAEPPRSLKSLCVDMACYFLARNDSAVTDDLRKRYEDALAMLKDVAKGVLDLPGMSTAPEDSSGTAGGAVVIEGPERVFKRNDGW